MDREYQLEEGDVDVIDVDKDLVDRIPTALQMGKVYQLMQVHILNQHEHTNIWNKKVHGSPRVNGNTSIALEEMRKIFTEEGIKAEIVQVGNTIHFGLYCWHIMMYQRWKSLDL